LHGTQIYGGKRTAHAGDDYSYSITFTAPTSPTTLYYQFGNASSPFNAPEGNQAPFLVLPDLNRGESLRSLVVKQAITGFTITVSNVPAVATQVIAVVDGNGSTYRATSSVSGGLTSFDMGVPVGTGYRVRVIAIAGTGTFPSVVAGGKALNQTVSSGAMTAVNIELAETTLTTDAANPTTTEPGSSVTLSWTIHDPANFLDNAGDLRMWVSEGSPPDGNLHGTQIYGGKRTAHAGDDYSYSITFTAPTSPTTLYYQFGNASYPFDAPEGNQAPFLVLPDLNRGESLRILSVLPKVTVNIFLFGSGSVFVTSSNSSFVCGISCSGQYYKGTNLHLRAAPTDYSLFSGWSGTCNGSGDCSLTMDDDKSVTATFEKNTAQQVRLNDTYYSTIMGGSGAYQAAVSGNPILIWGTDFSEDFTFNLNKAVTLTGGYDSDYMNNSGYTTLIGPVTIQSGSLAVEKLVIR